MPVRRSNPKIIHRAGELRKQTTPAEAKLWAYLRGNKINGVNFRRHTCPGGRCQGHAIGKYIVDFCSPKAKLIIELDGTSFGRNTWTKKITTKNGRNILHHGDTRSSAFGTMM